MSLSDYIEKLQAIKQEHIDGAKFEDILEKIEDVSEAMEAVMGEEGNKQIQDLFLLIEEFNDDKEEIMKLFNSMSQEMKTVAVLHQYFNKIDPESSSNNNMYEQLNAAL